MFVLVSAVSACGSGDDSELDQLIAEAERLSARYETASITDPDELPTGSATYRGVTGILVQTGPFSGDFEAILGRARVNVDFSGDDVNGRLYGFYGETAGRMNGELTVSNGDIDETDASFTADVAGTLSAQGRSATLADPIEGSFIGTNARALGAVGGGTATFNDGFEGDYILEILAER